MRIIGPILVRDQLERLAHLGRARGRVVGISGEKVYPAVCQKIMRHPLGMFPHAAHDRAGGDLDQHSAAQPVHHAAAGRSAASDCAPDASGSGSARRAATGKRSPVRPRGHAVVGNLHQQIAQPVDAEPRRIELRFLNVFVRHVKVASATQLQRNMFAVQQSLQLGDLFGDCLEDRRRTCPFAWGEQTMCVIPSAAAILAIAREVSTFEAPSSRPHRR